MDRKVGIHPGTYFLAALWLLVLPGKWGMGAVLAACVHELFHLMLILVCGGQVISVSVLPCGARMETTSMSQAREAVCALAGPLGSFSILLIAEYFPEAALCGLVQGAYNLLPIYPLDGGRILRCLLPEEAYRGMEAFFLTFLTGFGFWMGIQSRGVGFIFLPCLWFPVIQRKLSCKEPKLAVQ